MASMFSVGTKFIPILTQELADPVPTQSQSHMEDAELAHVVSLSLKVCSFTLSLSLNLKWNLGPL